MVIDLPLSTAAAVGAAVAAADADADAADNAAAAVPGASLGNHSSVITLSAAMTKERCTTLRNSRTLPGQR